MRNGHDDVAFIDTDAMSRGQPPRVVAAADSTAAAASVATVGAGRPFRYVTLRHVSYCLVPSRHCGVIISFAHTRT